MNIKGVYGNEKIYELGTEKEYHYIAENSLEAMKKHIYLLNLSNMNVKEDDIKETMYGYMITNDDRDYWIKK